MSSGRTFFEESNLDRAIYFSDGYFSPKQWMSFRSQIEGVRICNPHTVLEIGVGSGFVTTILRKCGYSVTTIDINPGLEPDYVGSITELNNIFSDKSFDVVLCAEVMEHLPFSLFETCINNIAKVSRSGAVVTLPSAMRQIISIYGHIPKKDISLYWALGKRKIPREHHWEVDNSKQTELKNISKIMQKYFLINETKRVEGNPYHMRFLLKTIITEGVTGRDEIQ